MVACFFLELLVFTQLMAHRPWNFSHSKNCRVCWLAFSKPWFFWYTCENVHVFLVLSDPPILCGEQKKVTDLPPEKLGEKTTLRYPDLITSVTFESRPYEKFAPGPKSLWKFVLTEKLHKRSDFPKGPAEKSMWKSLSKCRIWSCSEKTRSCGGSCLSFFVGGPVS